MYCVVACITTAFAAQAQDTRIVTEPVIPPTCPTLKAEKTGEAEKLGEKYEKTTDTARIQKAMDRCRPGRQWNWPPGKNANAFLSGSLELREGVTLLIDKSVTSMDRATRRTTTRIPPTPQKLLCGTMSNVSTAFITAQDAAKGNTPPRDSPGTSLQAADQRECEERGDHGRRRD